MVDLDRLSNVAHELQASIPSDIQEAREILKQRESIINQAQLEARRVKEAAGKEASATTAAAVKEQESRVDETEIVKASEAKSQEMHQEASQEAQQILQDAQRRAYRVIDEADSVGKMRREGADQYARETLFDLEERLSSQLGQIRRGIDALGLEVEPKVEAAVAS
jgi:cell division septum initiation protein DivIVA